MPSMPLPDLVILTGVDAKFFWQFFLLSESIRRASPRTRLLVCDFGLTPAQQRFFRDKDILLDMPADAGVYPHAWYYKAMLGSYISAPAVFWVDVDMIILDDIGALAARLCTEMERDDHMLAASCDPAGGIGAWLAQNQAPGFAARVVKLDPSLPYLSSGIFLCRSAAFLTQWQAECIAMPYEMLFEQNAFNLAAWTTPDAVLRLERHAWNLCGQDIGQTQCRLHGNALCIQTASGMAHVLHATSTDRAADILAISQAVLCAGGPVEASYRIVRLPDLVRDYQISLFDNALARELERLVATGCLAPNAAA